MHCNNHKGGDLMNKKILCIVLFLVFIFSVLSSFSQGNFVKCISENHFKLINKIENTCDNIDYWGLLISVGVYANNPQKNIDEMLIEVDNLYETLLISNRWDADHINVIKGENATVRGIIDGFRWLNENEDENDISLVYIATHGGLLRFDYPPLDEDDGKDAFLATYRSWLPIKNPFTQMPLLNPFAIITDDAINYFLNQLESQGICMIVDCCHSGGFNDNWSYAITPNMVDFADELGSDLKGRNRVIITSARKDQLSGLGFSYFLTEGLKGLSDENNNGICSAEESFVYAKSERGKIWSWPDPQIFDDYEGELSLTEVEMPPFKPLLQGPIIGKTNSTCQYQLYSIDAEGDRIRYFMDWGDGTIEQTGLCDSGEIINISHVWEKECTYVIKVIAQDELGAKYDDSSRTVVTMTDKCIVDQRQVESDVTGYANWTWWYAQSFIPSMNVLRKIEVGLFSWNNVEVTISVRKLVDGEDLVTISSVPIIRTVKDTIWWWKIPDWTMFDIFDIDVTPGDEYFFVCRVSGAVTLLFGQDNPYESGKEYYSLNSGKDWIEDPDFDVCFITYG